MQIRKPKTWNPKDLYQQFALQLLKDNPGVTETIEMRIKSGLSHGKPRYRVVQRKVQVGGYWSRYNGVRDVSNFWIYTTVKLPSGQNKVVEIINYDRWLRIMEAYFTAARRRIIFGEALNLGNRLGYIEPRHIERNFANRQVNFHETSKQPKVWDESLGKLKAAIVIYHMEPSYARIAWRKNKQVPGEGSYEFVPCHGDEKKQGFKQQFSEANENNPALKHTYPWYPLLPTVLNE